MPEVRRFGFRPALWPTLITLPALAVLVALGTWQVQRLQWKEDLIAERQGRFEQAPVPLPTAIADPGAWEYRRVFVVGEFLHDEEMLLQARTHQGRPGYHVVTPLRRAEGPVVLVDRGWVPLDAGDPAVREGSRIRGEVRVEGIARAGTRPSPWTPDNDPARDQWLWVDIPAMAHHAGVGAAQPVYIQAAPQVGPAAAALPIGTEPQVSLPNNHLQYAVTWYALAVSLAAVYVASQRRPREGEERQR